MKVQFFYRLDTLQIDAVYRDCTTESTVFKDPSVYAEVNVEDPPYEVTRDHKVVLDADGNIVGSEPSPNPVQPTPEPNPHQDLIDLINTSWDTGVPEKTEALKQAVLRLLGA